MAGQDNGRPLLAQMDKLRSSLEEARSIERTWDAVRSMIDERTSRLWSRPALTNALRRLGLASAADQALVGLLVRKREIDPVDEVLGHDAFQRACVGLARNTDKAICGQVGDHGVVFVSGQAGTSQRRRQRLLDLGDKAATLAESYGFRLHLGLSSLPASATLSEHYQAALEGAESALSQGVRIAQVKPGAARALPALSELRQRLASSVEERAGVLSARFDRYLEAVALHSGHRLDPARVHLEAGFERMAETLLADGTLEHKSFDDMRVALQQASSEARTVTELFAAYRRAVADIIEAVERPVPAHRDRSLRRALGYIAKHYSEPLSLTTVARVAGFAPNYFSILFKRREKTTFESYVRRLRIERAKHLLATTDFHAARVAQLSGLGTRQYMARVFQQSVGMTPRECRRKLSTTG